MSDRGSDRSQLNLHLCRCGETLGSRGCAGFAQEGCEFRIHVGPDRCWIDHGFTRERPRSRVWMLSVAEKFVEHYAYREEIGGDVPASQIRVRSLVWRCAGLGPDWIAD